MQASKETKQEQEEAKKRIRGRRKRSVTAGVNKPPGVVETGSAQPGAANRFEDLGFFFSFSLFFLFLSAIF